MSICAFKRNFAANTDSMDFSGIAQYFPDTESQTMDKLSRLQELYTDWNAKLNLISRNDFEHFWERHVLYSLAILPFFRFPDGARVIDVGTGGGFPGIPLAVWFPNVDFVLNDSIGKKLKAAEDVSKSLDLKNVRTEWKRSEEIKETFDFVTGRAVKSVPEFYGFTKHLISANPDSAIWYWKGGDFNDQLGQVPLKHTVFELAPHFTEEFFETKKIIKLYR